MAKNKTPTLRKPVLTQEAVLGFAEGRPAASAAKASKGAGSSKSAVKASGAATGSPLSRLPPSGDVRLTVNIRDDIHQRLKIEAVKRRTTVGELLEELVQSHL